MAERDYGTIVDRCFQIIEILCVVMREGNLATGQKTPTEARLFEYFESSNHWSPTGVELVVDWYYRILPEIYRDH